MTDFTRDHVPSRGLRVSPDFPDALRIILVAAPLLVMWIHVVPFTDLTIPATFARNDAGNVANQIAYGLLGIVAVITLSRIGGRQLRPLATYPLLLLFAWILVSVVLSQDVALSFRRMVLLIVVSALAGMLLVVPRSVRQFADVLSAVVLIVMVISYTALLVAPGLSIHSALDLAEPEHAGAWRGVFSHKNEAGAATSVFVMIGLFVYGVGRRLLGVAIVVLSAVFLVFTYSKTAILLLPVVLVLTASCRVIKGTPGRAIVLLGPLVLLSVVTLGPLVFPGLDDAVTALLKDATFTGRREIWDFASDHIAQKPLTGWGFGAFWTEGLFYAGSEKHSWVTQQLQAHNSYLEVALCMGIPGLLLTILAFVIGPFGDLQRISSDGAISPLAMFLLRVWMYTLTSAQFEAQLFDSPGPIFLMFLTAVFGFRYLAETSPVER